MLYYWWYDPYGAELCLWTNEHPGERGLTVGYRYLEEPTVWHYATILVPYMAKKTMQLTYLEWGPGWENYATNSYTVADLGEDDLPYVYKPRHVSHVHLVYCICRDAMDNGYGRLWPFFRKMLVYYRSKRWEEDE